MGKLDEYIVEAKKKAADAIAEAKARVSEPIAESIPLLQDYMNKAEVVIEETITPKPKAKLKVKPRAKKPKAKKPRKANRSIEVGELKIPYRGEDRDIPLDMSQNLPKGQVIITEEKPAPKRKGKLQETFELESAYAAMPPETRLILETLERLIEKVEQIAVTSHEIHVPPPIINVTLPETKKTVTKIVERDENNLVKSITETVTEEQLTDTIIESEDN